MKYLLAAIIFNCVGSFAQKSVPNVTLVNVFTGDSISLHQYAAASAIVVIFTSHECPYDNYYKQRIKELIDTYSGKVQFLLINSNSTAAESIDQMAVHYTDLNIPYLADKDQQVMTTFGARKSPEAFLLKPEAAKFTVQYSGAIDDNPQLAKDVKQNYLKDSISKLVSGEKIEITSTRVVGCSITN
jgi:peroxiredoxin